MPSKAKQRANYKLVAQSDWHARLGDRFRQVRERSGVGLRPLATMIGRCYFSIRRHEAGEMMLRSDDLIKAADALGVEPGALLTVEQADGQPAS